MTKYTGDAQTNLLTYQISQFGKTYALIYPFFLIYELFLSSFVFLLKYIEEYINLGFFFIYKINYFLKCYELLHIYIRMIFSCLYFYNIYK